MTINAGGRAAYSMAQHGRADSAAEMRNFVCNGGAVSTWGLKYGGGLNVLRILPQYVPSEPGDPATSTTPGTPATAGYWLPSKTGTDPMALTDWIRSYDGVKGFGQPGSTFLLRDQTDPYAPALGQTPPYIVRDEIKRAVDAGQDRPGWARLLTGGKGTFAVIPRTTTLYLVRAAIVSRGDDKPFDPPKGFGDSDAPVIMLLTKSSGESLLSAVSAAQVQGIVDPLDVHAGMFSCFYKLGMSLPPVAGRVMGKVHSGEDASGYGALLDSQFAYPGHSPISAAIPPVFLERAVARYKAWDDFVRFPTVAEQAAWLCETLPPDVVMYAFRNHPEWISDIVRQHAAAAVSVQVPYGMPPAQYGVPPAQYGAPPAQYGAPPAQYGVPPAQYGAPLAQYGAPPAYVPPQPQYGVPQPGYSQPPQQPEYRVPQPGYSQPQAQPVAPPEYAAQPQYVAPVASIASQPGVADVPFAMMPASSPPVQFAGPQYVAPPPHYGQQPVAPTAAGFAAMAAGQAIGGVGSVAGVGVAGQPASGWAQPVGIQTPTWASQPNPVANPAGVVAAGPQTSRSAAAANIAAQFGG